MGFWQAIVTILISIATAVVTSLITIWAQKRFFGPRLDAFIRDGEYSLFPSPTIVQAKISTVERLRSAAGVDTFEDVIQPEVRGEAIFVRATVVNIGRGVAMKCRAFLEDVDRYEDGEYKRRFFDCIPLCWSFLERDVPQVFDIPRGANVNLDLLSSHPSEGGDILIPRIIPLTLRYEGLFSEIGVYRLTVVIAAENAAPIKRRFKITWPGKRCEVKVCGADSGFLS